jgi:ISXO2-like transposase domain
VRTAVCSTAGSSIDDAYLGGERSGGKSGRGSQSKVPFVAAVQTTPEGKPELVCLRQQPFTHEEVASFAARSIAPTATVVTDGLWCFLERSLSGTYHAFDFVKYAHRQQRRADHRPLLAPVELEGFAQCEAH